MPKITDLMDPAVMPEGDEGAAVARARAVVFEPMLVAVAVAGYKRRLQDATPRQLATDKRVARKAGYAFLKVMEAIEGERPDWLGLRELVSDEQRAAASTLRWVEWLPARASDCRRESGWCASWVIRVNLGARRVRRLAHALDTCALRLDDLLLEIEKEQ